MPRKTAKPATTPPTEASPSTPIAASYESTGAAGVDLEVDVVVQLLGAVLADASDRLLPNDWIPRAVRVQRRDGPRGFDDITVEATLPSGATANLFMQVRRELSLTADGGDFETYVRAVHARDVADPDAAWFAMLVAGKLTPACADVQAVAEWARMSESDADFASKCDAPGVLNARKRALIAAVTRHLEGLEGASIWRVLRRLRAAETDFADATSRDAQVLSDRLATLLAPAGRTSEDLRQALRARVLREARSSPTYRRLSILADLDGAFHFSALPRIAPDLGRLEEEAANALASIDTSIAGLSLLRCTLYAKASTLSEAKALRIVGDAGCGKSAILTRLATAADRRLVIKDDRASGRTWAEYAANLSVKLPAADILEALAARPGAVLAIDGADRLLSTERRGIVVDILRAIASSSTRANWRIVTTARDIQARDLVRDALLEVGLEAGERLDVGALDQEDADLLGLAVPVLCETIARTDLGGRNRDLFTLRETWIDPGVDPVGSEVGLAARWATRGDRAKPPDPTRAAAVAQIADQILATRSVTIGRAELNPQGLRALLDDGSLRAVPHRDLLVFAHDVYEDWALARAFDRRRGELANLLRAADQPLWWLRSVRLAGQIALETSGPAAWFDLIKTCFDAKDLDPVWWRTLLVAPLYSERAGDLLTSAWPLLDAEDATWLERLIDTLQVLESRPDEKIFERATGTLEERQRVAAAFPVPTARSWLAFFRWGGPRWSAWPGRLVPKLSQLANSWLRASEGWQHRVAQMLVRTASDWLTEIEDARTFASWEDRRPPFGYESHDHRLWDKTASLLREGLAYGVTSAPDVVEAYLVRTSQRDRDRECDELLKMPRWIPSQMPAAWADFCIARFAPRRPRVRHDLYFGPFDSLSYHDAGLHSLNSAAASPRYAGFDQLFEVAPAEGLRMLRKFEKRASVFYRHYSRQHDRRRPRAVRVQFPWGEVPLWGDENTYRWARGILGPEVLGSAYMALDLWLAHQAANGRPLEELFRLVIRPHGLNATLCPCINVAVEHINTPGQIDAVAPILAEPRVWNFEVKRFTDDLTFARQPLVPYYSAAQRPAIVEVGARYAKRQHIRTDLTLPFLVLASREAQAALEARVEAWSPEDLADFDDELGNAGTMAGFEAQLERYRADLDRSTLELRQVGDRIHVSLTPPPPIAEQIAQLEDDNAAFNAATSLLLWADQCLKAKALQTSIPLAAAIERAQAYDAPSLFAAYRQDRFNDYLAAQAVAMTAAVVARLAPDDVLAEHWAWATETLLAAVGLNAVSLMFDIDESHLANDPRVSAAQGITALISRGGDRALLSTYLLGLATDRRHYIAAAVVANLDFENDPILAWAVTRAAFADTQYARGKRWWDPDLRAVAQDRQRRRERAYRDGRAEIRLSRLRPLPSPPPPLERYWAWQKAVRRPFVRSVRPYRVLFQWNRVKALLAALPVKSLAKEPRIAAFVLTYLEGVVRWAKAYSERGRRHDGGRYPYELMGEVGKLMGRMAFFTSPDSAATPWRVFTIFEERDNAFELVGDYLEGLSTELVASSEPPSPAFWRKWDPAAKWVMGPRDKAPRQGRHAMGELSGPTAAVGFVGPYATPIPPGWPHVEALLPRIDDWADHLQQSGGAAAALLRFTERCSLEQLETYALPWIERWLDLHEGQTDFWQYRDVVNQAASVVLRLQPEDQFGADVERQRRLRHLLAKLADEGSLTARQALTAVASRRPSDGER